MGMNLTLDKTDLNIRTYKENIQARKSAGTERGRNKGGQEEKILQRRRQLRQKQDRATFEKNAGNLHNNLPFGPKRRQI